MRQTKNHVCAAPADETEAVLDRDRRITLNNADRDRFLQKLDSDEGPNEALVQAAQDFKQRYGELS